MDVGMGLIQMTDGDFVLVGLTRSKGVGASDMWLLKTSVSLDMSSSKDTITTAGNPELEFLFVFLCPALIILSTRKRRP